MPATIDISDIAIAKDEARHRLHLFGPIASHWGPRCIICAKELGTDKNSKSIRCRCGEDSYCSAECKTADLLHLNEGHVLCARFGREPVLPNRTTRPGPGHRRAIIFHPKPGISWTAIWIEVQGDKLIIDHPLLNQFFGDPNAKDNWLDLAVLNPALIGDESEKARQLGHGLVMGESACRQPLCECG